MCVLGPTVIENRYFCHSKKVKYQANEKNVKLCTCGKVEMLLPSMKKSKHRPYNPPGRMFVLKRSKDIHVAKVGVGEGVQCTGAKRCIFVLLPERRKRLFCVTLHKSVSLTEFS